MPNVSMQYGLLSAMGTGASSQGVTYTRLWTNPDHTAAFAAQTVTLSDDVTNYDGIRIVWKQAPSTAADETTWSNSGVNALSMIVDIRNKRDIIVSGNSTLNGSALTTNASGNVFVRRWYFTSDTGISFTGAERSGASGTAATVCIPLFIDGVTLND